MSFQPEHELHKRRFGRNLGLGLTLIAFVALVFGLTVAKVTGGGDIRAFDHTIRPELVPQAATTQPAAEQPKVSN